MIRQALQAWRPPPRLRLSEWAEAHFYLSAESSADPGRWHCLPYQREPMDCCTDPLVQQISLMKSARIGYSKMLNAVIAFHIHHDPCAIMLVQPTLTDAKGYAKEEIAPMLRDCAVLRDRILDSGRTRNTLLHLRFHGGLLQVVGARSPSSFRRVSRRIVLGDEVDAYPPSAGEEGDPISLAIRRSDQYWNRKLVWGSTPTRSGASRIERLYLEGDQRRYYVPCTQCGHMDYLVFERHAVDESEPRGHLMRWTRGAPSDAGFVCRRCGGLIAHRDKRAIIEAGEWRAHAPFMGHASFHLWAAYSYAPHVSWAQLAAEYEAASSAGPERLQTFVNTALGESWAESVDTPDWARLYERREPYPIGSCPIGVLCLTAGVDVQKDRVVYEVVGWGRRKVSWSIDAGVIPGDTSDLSSRGPWMQLDALLARTFHHAGGADMQIALLAIDSGYNTQTVYGWARGYPLSRVIAIKGYDAGGALVSAPSKVDVTVSGKRVGYKVWRVATAMAKTELYGWLNLRLPTEEERGGGAGTPPGYCHFPQYGDEYFRQLSAEQLVRQRTGSGFAVFHWTLPPGRDNHHLDARIYARAAAAVYGLDRSRESDWRRLEDALGLVPDVDGDRPPPPSTPTSPPRTSAAPPTRAQWIQRQGRGWLKGDR